MRFILFIGFLLVSNYALLACDCDEPSNNVASFDFGFKSADFILEIKIKSTSQEKDLPVFGPVILVAEVLKIYKGEVFRGIIEIYTYYDGGGMCYYPFESGKTYLFYGRRNQQSFFESSICDRTGELENKSFDLKLLKAE